MKIPNEIQRRHLRPGTSRGMSNGMATGMYMGFDKALWLSYISKRPHNSKSSFLEWITKEYRYEEGLPL